jgi:hypothetical protein
MELWVYAGTTGITIFWSVWLYLLWSDKAKFTEESALRTVLMTGPSLYFLLTAFAGWYPEASLRIDLLGLAALNTVTILSAVLLFLFIRIGRHGFRKAYAAALITYNSFGILLVLCIFSLRLFPPFLIRLSSLLARFSEVDFFSILWAGLNPETNDRDIAGTLNKILIALFSYVPLMALRFLYIRRRYGKLQKDMLHLQSRISQLEKKIRE